MHRHVAGKPDAEYVKKVIPKSDDARQKIAAAQAADDADMARAAEAAQGRGAGAGNATEAELESMKM